MKNLVTINFYDMVIAKHGEIATLSDNEPITDLTVHYQM